MAAQLNSYDTDFVARRTQILTIWPFVVKVFQTGNEELKLYNFLSRKILKIPPEKYQN